MNADLKTNCPCGPTCSCNPCACTEGACGPEAADTDGPACFCGSGCTCES